MAANLGKRIGFRKFLQNYLEVCREITIFATNNRVFTEFFDSLTGGRSRGWGSRLSAFTALYVRKGKPGDTVKGTILAVDDQWNGLTITKDFSVSLEAGANGINNVTMPHVSTETWYTVDGLRLDAKPTKPGVYVVNGQKVIVK